MLVDKHPYLQTADLKMPEKAIACPWLWGVATLLSTSKELFTCQRRGSLQKAVGDPLKAVRNGFCPSTVGGKRQSGVHGRSQWRLFVRQRGVLAGREGNGGPRTHGLPLPFGVQTRRESFFFHSFPELLDLLLFGKTILVASERSSHLFLAKPLRKGVQSYTSGIDIQWGIPSIRRDIAP